ncbi:MAG: helix-turn-helix domain-containing protein [Helicobacteraceae bacterium]
MIASYKTTALRQDKSRIAIAKNSGKIQSSVMEFQDGIKVYFNDFEIYQDTSAHYKFDFQGVTINIVFDAGHFYVGKTGFKIEPLCGNTLINYINNEEGRVHYRQNAHVKSLFISVSQGFLKENSWLGVQDLIKDAARSQMLASKPSGAKTVLCAREIYACLQEARVNYLLIWAKILEIISYELFSRQELLRPSPKGFTLDELQTLQKAKEILENTSARAPSIKILARRLHTNEFKLKHGMKAVYNTSVYGLHLRAKMNEARRLLTSTDLSVCEIAARLGYKQPHGLSVAFKKIFGVAPGAVRKQEK